VVSGDGRGVVGHAGTRLLTDIADVTGLTGAGSAMRCNHCGAAIVAMIRVGSRSMWR